MTDQTHSPNHDCPTCGFGGCTPGEKCPACIRHKAQVQSVLSFAGAPGGPSEPAPHRTWQYEPTVRARREWAARQAQEVNAFNARVVAKDRATLTRRKDRGVLLADPRYSDDPEPETFSTSDYAEEQDTWAVPGVAVAAPEHSPSGYRKRPYSPRWGGFTTEGAMEAKAARLYKALVRALAGPGDVKVKRVTRRCPAYPSGFSSETYNLAFLLRRPIHTAGRWNGKRGYFGLRDRMRDKWRRPWFSDVLAGVMGSRYAVY